MYRATQLSPNRWAIPPQIMSSGDILTTGYPASARFPAGDTSSIASSSISPKPRGLSTESWNIGAVSESQWTQTRDLGPSRPSVLTYGGVEDGEPGQQSNQRPTNTYGGYQPQPPPRPERQRTALQQPQYDDEESPSPEPEQMHLGRTNKKRMRGKCQYTGTQGLQVDLDQPLPHMDSASRQGRHGSSSKAPSPDAYAPSPVPNMHTQPSRCHCGTSDPSRKYHTRTTTPSTTASSPKSDIAQPKPHRRFSSYADLSPDDQLTLRNLVQHNMPARKQHRILTRSSWRPTKSRKYSSTDSSSLDEPSLDDQLGTGQGIEKVVIVYLRDGEKVA
ncbi:MAG: hypothetical protein LQ345_000901 [Seirophora villosa]|nr:MAG: hypothetical protein LQ345_000901 [Seirophora villosa]